MDGHVYISQSIFLSWLDERGGRILSRNLERRLQRKFDMDSDKTRRSLFLTLTLDPADYGGVEDSRAPIKAWQEATQGDGHLKLFIRRLKTATKINFTGKWLAKREFQESGMLHYHLILYDVGRIDHDVLTKAWGKGYVWVERVNPNTASYVAKYQGKSASVPGWLYDLPGRSVKLVATSPGFWKGIDPPPAPSPIERPSRPPAVSPAGMPNWLRSERARQTVTLRNGRGDSVKCTGDASTIALFYRLMGGKFERVEFGAYKFKGSINDAKAAVRQSCKQNPLPLIPGIEETSAYHDISNRTYKKADTETAGDGGSAAVALLDTTHKNKDEWTDRTDPIGRGYGVETRYPTQVEFYGPDVLACMDPAYMESGAVIDGESC